jgi:hypothetical protein
MPVFAHALKVLSESAGESLDIDELVIGAFLEIFRQERVHSPGFVGEDVEFLEELAYAFNHLGPHLGIKIRELVYFLLVTGGRGECR